MVFNSLEFLVFTILFFALWPLFRKKDTARWSFITAMSFVFYGWWDWRFLGLIAFSTFVDFFAGRAIEKAVSKSRAKLFLAISLVTNLGLLAYFKYANFFIESWIEAWAGMGVEMHASSLNIILPVGISFYTFQTLSYTIDVYRGKIEPTDDVISFFGFVSFFPQLVAGPIVRAKHLLPQFYTQLLFEINNPNIMIKTVINNEEAVSSKSKCKKIERFEKES